MQFTHQEKIYWPKEKYTKGDVIAYYQKIAPYILPYLKDRPESLNRHPHGITGENFYQKNVGEQKVPQFVKTLTLKTKTTGKKVRYALIQNKDSLLYFVNFGCIEINPWQSRRGHLEKPDYLTIDLDPHGRPFDEVVQVALEMKKILDSIGAKSYIKTSGKTGLHLMLPLKGAYTYLQARTFAKLFVGHVHEALPALTTLEQRLAKRHGKIYLDIARNAYGQTTVAPYSVRPYPGATVSTPLRWSEVKKGLRPGTFTIKTIFPRLQKEGDLLQSLYKERVDLKKAARALKQLS